MLSKGTGKMKQITYFGSVCKQEPEFVVSVVTYFIFLPLSADMHTFVQNGKAIGWAKIEL